MSIIEPMKKGLVMEGGAMRGLFTAGVIDVLMENGINFDGACGVSAGACFGVNYKSSQIGRVIRYNLKFNRNWRYKGIRSLIFTGDIYGADFCYHELPSTLDYFDIETFVKNPMEFYVVATDLNTGKAVYKKLSDGKYNDLEWIRASASMPIASRVVKIDGYELLDGGISDSIPLKFMNKTGYEKNLVILTQPADFVKKPYTSIMKAFKLFLHKYPNTIDALKNRHTMYNEQLAYVSESEKHGDSYVIRPPEPLNIGSIEKDENELKRVYELGRKTCIEQLDEIRKFLEER